MAIRVTSWALFTRAFVLVSLAIALFGDYSTGVSAGGNTFYVAPGGSDRGPCSQAQPCGSFTEAISRHASPGDTISAAQGTYNESEIRVTMNLTINGHNSIVNAGGSATFAHRVFYLGGQNVTITLNDVTATGGYEAGTTADQDVGGGGGILVGYHTTATMNNVIVKNNTEVGGLGGGGVYSHVGTLTLNGCTIDGNIASAKGGGINNDGGTLTVNDSTITNNRVNAGNQPDGGGIINLGPNVTINGGMISNNTALRYGGGIANITNSKMTITGTTIRDNTSTDVGGGIYNDGDDGGKFPTSMSITGSKVTGNKTLTTSGGGLENLSVMDITQSTIDGNTAGDSGGGILSAGTLRLTTTTISNNTAKGNGGGINFEGGVGAGVGTITGSTVSGNTASGPGGGVFVAQAGTVTLMDSTISNNASSMQGGGAFVGGGGVLTLDYSTVASNTNPLPGGIGGLFNQGSTVHLLGTLLAGNTNANCGGAPVASQGFDLSSDATCPGVPQGAVSIGPLANNGGATQTHALLAGSAAIDQGGASANGCPAADQIGTSRPQGSACDIGAFELKGGAPPPVTAPPTQTVILGNPVRALDTRAAAQSGQGACTTAGHGLGAGASFDLKVTGVCTGVPDTAIGIKGNVTVVAGGSPGFVTLYPTGQTLPVASNANFTPGAVAPNSFTVGIGAGGNVTIYASAPTNVIVDIVSYYLPLAGGSSVKAAATSLPLYFHPLAAPVRLFDSRSGQSACVHPNTPLAGDTSLKIVAASACTGIPGNALAVEGNGTVVADAGGGPGFITFYPGGATLPLASNLNYLPGQVAPNNFSVGLGGDGSFNSYALTTTDLVIDVTGYYDTNSGGGLLFHALATPVRLLDSRPGQSACSRPGTPLPAGSSLSLSPAASSSCTGIPANAAAIVGNGTVIADTGGGAGFVTFYPGDKSLPLASNLNYIPGQVVPNAFVVGLGGDGAFKSYVSTTIDLAIDLAGYFATT